MRMLLAMALALASCSAAGAADRALLSDPAMSKTQIVFDYGGELWSVPRGGGEAHVLASGMDLLAEPMFSPDGSQIAFTGTYDKNTDVYVIPATGGQPRRLTYHSDPDIAVGWTPDGKSILFRSHRYSYSDPNRLFTVPLTGGFPTELPLPTGEMGSYSDDGSHLAYVPGFQWEPFWKGYKGGQHTEIWLSRLADSSTVRIPNLNSNESDPMWVGSKVYFLSDRDGPVTLYAYDTGSGQVQRLIDNKGFDITSASAGPGGIIYSQFGELYIYDYASGATHAVPVTVAGDLPQRRPYFQEVADDIIGATLSPSGVRAAFEAHGEILTVPAKHGSIQNLTHSPGVMDRGPAWSFDGKSIAYFSDGAGEYDLEIQAQDGTGPVRRVSLGQDDAFYDGLTWSPDSKKVFFEDQKLNLWYVDTTAAHPKPVKVATDPYAELHQFDASWSADSRWIAYARVMPNYLHAIFVYDLRDGSTHQITDGTSDCLAPQFDWNGKYFYFTSSTDTGLAYGWLDMTRLERPVTRQVYVATLQSALPSPLAPRDGFEKSAPPPASAKSGGKSHAPSAGGHDQPPAVNIDFEGLQRRAVPLPVPAANYVAMTTGKAGDLFLVRGPLLVLPSQAGPGGPPVSVLRFALKERKLEDVVDGIWDLQFAPSGAKDEKIVYRKGKDWFIADAKPHAAPDHLNLGDMRVLVEPHQQWAQMFRDAWRMEHAFFYNPTFDGLDLNAAEKEFADYLPGIASRDDLSFLFREMMSYLAVGHMFIRGGYQPKMDEITVGLLGADYRIENGHYRIVRIYDGGRWNPGLYAPLAQPGLEVKQGDYLLAVNGNPLPAGISLYEAFQDLANKTVTLTVGPDPDMTGSRQVTVKTIPSEAPLRHAAWLESNAQTVARLSGGKLAYVYLPDTAFGGFVNFNRYFFSQVDKQGVIIDERFNHGGLISDYIIQSLERRPMAVNVTRWGKMAVTPPEAIFGPKVMIINQFAGSGGDALPWFFKMDHVGTLVGERTWGGLVGIGGYPQLMDGGSITAPRIAVEGLDGTFPVENHGVSPDVTVWEDPGLVRQGHDPQLERAVAIALQQLEAHPLPQYQRPPWRNYHPKLPPLPQSPTSVVNE